MSPRDTVTEGPAPPVSAPARPRPPVWLLVAMIGIGPFTMQVLVPSLPAMGRDLGASTATVQLTVTLYLIAIGVGQLIYGPLSDRFGRRPLLLGGLAVYAAASLAAAAAPGIATVIVARMIQAVGACAGVVLARAVIRDVWPRDEAASVLGYVTMGMTVAPMLAPVAGSLLEQRFGWRAIMLACLAFAVPLALACRARLPETLVAPQSLPTIGAMLGAFRGLWMVPAFRTHAGVVAASTAVFFAFLGGAPYVVVQGMGQSPVVFALAFASISVFFAAGSWMAGRFARRLGVVRLMTIGVAINLAGSALAVAVILALPPHLLGFFVPMGVVALGNGMLQPSAFAGALSAKPQLAGTASAMVGALQMLSGAALTFLVGLVEFGAGLGTTLAMAGASGGAWLALRGARRAG